MPENTPFATLLNEYLAARKLRARGLATLVNRFFNQQGQPELADLKVGSVHNWLGTAKKPPMLPQETEPILQIASALGLNRAQTTQLLLAADHPPLDRLADTLHPPRVARHPLTEEQRLRHLLAHWAHSVPNNLPSPLTSFVGRDRECLDRALELTAAPHRLITLIGPGGVGKTRLAIETARLLLDTFADGIWLVRLDSVATPDEVFPAIARAVGLANADQATLPRRLATYLRTGRTLLVLDNLEHLLAIGPTLTTLLAATTGTRILATSRTPLRVAGETTRAVVPFLPVGADLAALREQPAVALFADRARAADAHFALGSTNALAIALLATRLDGLPLALELAAARLRDFPFDQLQSRFARALELAAAGPHDLSPRQQSLHQTIAWSYDLLPPARQHLFRHLAALPGGATVAALATVAGRPADATFAADLAALLDYHLIERRDDADEARHTLLNTIREFAHARLLACDELASSQTRLLAWCSDLAERAGPQLEGGPAQSAWVRRLDAERDNLHAALAWAHRHNTAGGLHLAARLLPYWLLGRDQASGVRWLAAFLADHPEPTLDRARACYGLGYLSVWHDWGQARPLLEEALRLADAQEDESLALAIFVPLCLALLVRGDAAAAQRMMAEWRTRLGTADDPRLEALHLLVQGYASDRRGELTAAAAQLSRARDLAVRYSLPLLDCMIAIRLGETQLSLGQPREATETTTTLLRTATAIGATRYQILAHYRLGTIAERRGQLIIATDEFNAALVLADEADDEFGRAHARLGLGRLALWQHDADRACHLLAQAFDLAAALKDPLHMFEVLHHWWQARWQRGERRAALAQARKCLRLALRSQSTRVQRAILASLADMATARGDTQLAAGWRAAIGPSSTESGVELTAGIAEALSCAETWLARQLRR